MEKTAVSLLNRIAPEEAPEPEAPATRAGVTLDGLVTPASAAVPAPAPMKASTVVTRDGIDH
jgi:hypothetical protein